MRQRLLRRLYWAWNVYVLAGHFNALPESPRKERMRRELEAYVAWQARQGGDG